MANETWTIRRCLDWTSDYLKDRGDERPRLSAEWLLSGVTGLSRTEIYVNFDKPMSSEELAAMHTAVVRRAKGEPLQYIIGETSFRTIDVICEPGVLIPRPETELLVEEVLAYLDREVIGAAPAAERGRVELPWNAEVEAALQAEIAAAKEKDEAPVVERELRDDDFDTPEDGEGTIETADGAEGDADVSGTASVEEGEFSEGAPAQDGESGQIRCARVLEVGCGTGCISLSIASERSGRAQCVAIDIEPRAVDLSIRNRDALGMCVWAISCHHSIVRPSGERLTCWSPIPPIFLPPSWSRCRTRLPTLSRRWRWMEAQTVSISSAGSSTPPRICFARVACSRASFTRVTWTQPPICVALPACMMSASSMISPVARASSLLWWDRRGATWRN